MYVSSRKTQIETAGRGLKDVNSKPVQTSGTRVSDLVFNY
jgi:hypothetical protein